MIKAIVGLGNPGLKFERTRHNIGFRVVDELARRGDGTWKPEGNMLVARVTLHERPVLLVKPQTFMNSSGAAVAALKKDGIGPEHLLVVHDELELPFGTLKIRAEGSARGHNGLRSIIEALGPNFARLRFGVGRPEHKDEVPDYVLKPFTEPAAELEELIASAADMAAEVVV